MTRDYGDPRAEYLAIVNRPTKKEMDARQVVQDIIDGRRELTQEQSRALLMKAALGHNIAQEKAGSDSRPRIILSAVIANIVPEAKTDEGRWLRSFLGERMTWLPHDIKDETVSRIRSMDADECVYAILHAWRSMEPGMNRDAFLGNWSWALKLSFRRLDISLSQFSARVDDFLAATPPGKKDQFRREYGALARI